MGTATKKRGYSLQEGWLSGRKAGQHHVKSRRVLEEAVQSFVVALIVVREWTGQAAMADLR